MAEIEEFYKLPPLIVLVSPAGVPSCLKPEAQQAAGVLEAILKYEGV